MNYLPLSASLMCVTEAREMGFDAAQIELLLAEGAILPDAEHQPWQPTSLEDVDRLGWQLVQLEAEAAAIQAQAALRVKALTTRRETILRRYEADCREIVDAAIKRKPDGSRTKQSLTLERVTAQFRKVGPTAKVVDEQAFIQAATANEVPEAVLDAVRVTVEFAGSMGLDILHSDPDAKLRLLVTPLKAALAADPEAALPGVERVPGYEAFSLNAAKGATP